MTEHEVVDRWLSTPSGAMAVSWYVPTQAPARDLAVMVVLGIAHEDRTVAVGVRPLAEQLANDGVSVLVVRLEGTDQSTGDLEAPDLLSRWEKDVNIALAHVRTAGFARVAVVGLQIGALLALTVGNVDRMVLWAPALDGRRFRRELLLMAQTGEVERSDGHTMIGAFQIPSATLDAIGSIAAARTVELADRPLLVVAGPRQADDPALELLRSRGCDVELVPGASTARWLSASSELTHIPQPDIEMIHRWLVEGSSERNREVIAVGVSGGTQASITSDGWCERFVELSASGLHGVLGGPVSPSSSGLPALLLLSTLGPGRMFVDLARSHQTAGGVALRVDLSGSGTSQRRAGQGYGELYGRHAIGDVRAAVDWLRVRGHQHVVVMGYCATAHVAVVALPHLAVEGVVAWNVELYVPGPSWRTSDGVAGPVMARLFERMGVAHRAYVVRSRIRRAYLPRTAAVRSMGRPADPATKVLLQYDDRDLGLAHIDRFRSGVLGRRRDQGLLEVRSYRGLGHALGGLEARRQVVDDARVFLERLARVDA